MDKPTMHMLSVQEKGGETRKANQYLAAVAAAIGAVIAGTILAWTSPAISQLEPFENNIAIVNNTAIVNITNVSVAAADHVLNATVPFSVLMPNLTVASNGTVVSINSTVVPNGTVVSINGTVVSINGTAVSNGTVVSINGKAFLNGKLIETKHPLINKRGEEADFLLDAKESGLVSSILAIGAAISALPVGFLAQKVGRRPTILILSIPFMLNWLLTIFANGPGMLIAARFFAGLGTGGICVAAPMYIGEIAETSIRGSLGAFFQLFLTVGILFTFIIGAWTHWRTLSAVSAALPPLLVIVFWWMPETPQYLLGKNRRREAEKALRWLRGPDADLSSELEDMQKEIDDAARQSASLRSMITNRTTLMAFICSLGLMFFQQFSGINAVIFYTDNIFRSAGSTIDSRIATIIVGVVQTIATCISSLLIERAGRKILLLQSSIIMGLTLVMLGIYFKLLKEVASVGWLPLVCLILFIISFSLGFGPIPWMMMAELFPVEYRGTASGITVIMNWCLVFIVTLCFPLMKEAIGIHSCFWFFAGFMVIGTFFVFFLIPETKGKTISQIQAILGGRK